VSSGHVLALCGGVGGAKLAFGLTRLLGPDELTIVVNTGDDFEHLGLAISPDIDTVAYTLSGLADPVRGWGRLDESWNFMAALSALGGENWFNLGDRDLALHVERTRRLAAGESLSEVTSALTGAMGIAHPVVPMSDLPVRTMVDTEQGELAFQTYFVREQCRPVARGMRYAGAAEAKLSPGFAAALARSDLRAVIYCPSNPYLSLGPILALPGVRGRLQALAGRSVAVSPIIGGRALKGPAAKMMAELGVEPGVEALATHYAGLIAGLVIDREDVAAEPALRALGLNFLDTQAIMHDDDDRVRLARETLDLAERCGA